MNKNKENFFLKSLETLELSLKALLTQDDEEELYSNKGYLQSDFQKLQEANRLIESNEKINDHDLATVVIVDSSRYLGDIVQDLQNICDVLKNIKKHKEKL